MIRLIIGRILQLGLVTWVVGTLTFILTRVLPGDIAFRIAAGRYGDEYVNTVVAESIREELGLNQPALSLYGDWLLDLISGNLGVSLVNGAPVSDMLLHEFGHSFYLALLSLLFSLLLGPPLGIWVAFSKGGVLDRAMIVVAAAVRSLPAYMIGVILIIVFAVQLKWFPVAGHGQFTHYILPAATLALGLIVVSARVTRNTTLAVIKSEYYHFSRIKGLSAIRSFFRHGLKNLAIPVIAYHGVQLIYLIEGVVIVETLFAWPGIGHAMVHAIIDRDIPMIQGTAMIMALSFVFLNTCIDLICYWIDPRKRII